MDLHNQGCKKDLEDEVRGDKVTHNLAVVEAVPEGDVGNNDVMML